jgi:hypothetical protein
MEYTIDVDLIGEILIPLENTKNKTNSIKTFYNLEDVINSNFNKFRSVIFQGEILRVFIAMKIDTSKSIENLLEETFFKIEFDPFSDDINNQQKENNDNNEYRDDTIGIKNENNDLYVDHTFKKQSDLFSIHRKTIFNYHKQKKENEYKNYNYEFLTRKTYIKEKKIAIFEILKHLSKKRLLL